MNKSPGRLHALRILFSVGGRFHGKAQAALFFSLFAVLFVAAGLHHSLPLRPQSIHQWAQCDRASVALRFVRGDMNIFLPRVHNLSNGSGIAGMEFPLINWLAAALYRLSGFHEALYRLLMTALVALGLYAGARLGELFTGSFWTGTLLVFIFFLSPVLDFYTPNFLPDPAGLAFLLISWYFFFKFKETASPIYAIFWTLFISLAGLVKVTAAISPVVVAILLLMDSLGFPRQARRIESRRLLLGGILLAGILISSWYLYADHLNRKTGSSVFTLGMHPPGDWAEAVDIWRDIRMQWLPYYYGEMVYALLGASGLWILIQWRRADPHLLLVTGLLYSGGFGFIVLFFRQFRNHDYYAILLFVPVLFHLILFADVFRRSVPSVPGRGIFTALLLGLLIHSIGYSRRYQHRRYHGPMNASFSKTRDYMDLDPVLKRLGIGEGQQVVSFGDDTPDVTLYLMNRTGVTVDASTANDSVREILKTHSYAVVRSFEEIAGKPYSGYFSRMIGVHGDLSIFAIPETPLAPSEITLERFLTRRKLLIDRGD